MALRPLQVGPWTGVRDTKDPFDDNPNQLIDALNSYIPDPQKQSGLYARPGFVLANAGAQLSTDYNKAICPYWGLNNSVYNYLWSGSKIYEFGSDLTTLTDVTPANISIDSGSNGLATNGGRPYMIVFADQMIFSDGINKPWIATAGSIASTAQTIEYQTAATSFLIGTTDTKLGNLAIPYQVSTGQATFAANAPGNTMPVGTVPASTWAIWRLSIHTGGTLVFTSAAANYTTGYATEALAIAALPAVPAGNWNAGYVTLLASASTWVAGTDALAGGASGNPATTTNYSAGNAPPWSAFGQPCIYAGALFFIANVLSGVASRDTILWCEPNQPTVGYEQTGYADFWNLIQDSSNPIFALGGTNFALYYWRDRSIGVISGAPGVNFQSTATHDSVSTSTGTRSPGALAQFGDTFYFVDTQGRPWKFATGTTPEPIWLQMRQQWIDNAAGAASPNFTQVTACGAIHPELNLYLVAIWTPDPATLTLPVDAYAFDAVTGTYVGRWQVTVTTGIGIGAIGTVRDTNRDLKLCMIGNNAAGSSAYPSSPGYVWVQSSITDANWKDNGVVPQISATTSRLGYSVGTVWNADMAAMVTMSAAAVTVTVQTPYTTTTTEVMGAAPGTSLDGTYRIPFGLDIQAARGMQFTMSPTGVDLVTDLGVLLVTDTGSDLVVGADSQWGLQRLQVYATPALAGPEDL